MAKPVISPTASLSRVDKTIADLKAKGPSALLKSILATVEAARGGKEEAISPWGKKKKKKRGGYRPQPPYADEDNDGDNEVFPSRKKKKKKRGGSSSPDVWTGMSTQERMDRLRDIHSEIDDGTYDHDVVRKMNEPSPFSYKKKKKKRVSTEEVRLSHILDMDPEDQRQLVNDHSHKKRTDFIAKKKASKKNKGKPPESHPDDWWGELTHDQKVEYMKNHPKSTKEV